jgi:hypothetical protein
LCLPIIGFCLPLATSLIRQRLLIKARSRDQCRWSSLWKHNNFQNPRGQSLLLWDPPNE